jgi:hypothetical protein
MARAAPASLQSGCMGFPSEYIRYLETFCLPFCSKNTENRMLGIFGPSRDEVAGVLRGLHCEEPHNFALQNVLLGEAEVGHAFITWGRLEINKHFSRKI